MTVSSAAPPHVVRPRAIRLLGRLIRYALLALMFAALGALAVAELFFWPDTEAWKVALIMLVAVAGLAACAWRASVTITEVAAFDDAGVTVRTLWGRRRFERADLRSWRAIGERMGMRRIELHADGARRRFVVAVPMQDAVIAKWLDGATDLDQADRAEALQALARDKHFGPTPWQRLRAGEAEGRLVMWLQWIGLAVMVWATLAPWPNLAPLAAAAALPIVLCAAAMVRRRWRLGAVAKDHRPSIAFPVSMCAFALAWRAWNDWHLLDWGEAIAIATACALIVVLALAPWGQTLRISKALGWLAVAALYCYGVLIPLNGWYDRASPTILRARVEGSYSKSLDLRVGAPLPSRVTMPAPRSFVDAAATGDEVCISLRRGRFGIRFYHLTQCR